MLRTVLGTSKHSRAFRRAMALELRPLRSYSVEQPPPQPITETKFAAVKEYMKRVQTEDTHESEKVLKLFRKMGAISIVVVLASIGYAAYDQSYNGNTQIVEEQQVIKLPDLTQDIRYQKRGDEK
ncbi:conserved hypothetical protein [Candida dubliniensis CD36]|uniref:Uncharacterized protein n=1 Tax=Candida dubliniensis (strain CD36 / ATCC MYA-646 / CBS 7987 / NCPF 3949 / NRRL Y-17841) TaxID=573826 RepID=B9W770_CANDC|nr:conserved hypothetical protein [Candida dubliniensis CD36]CAX44529.1 conserved hypothetical protein [Candida dubliniensis CD36]